MCHVISNLDQVAQDAQRAEHDLDLGRDDRASRRQLARGRLEQRI